MRQTQLFTKTRKEAPKDEESKNAQLLIRAGYIHKEMAGVYDLLPLGLKVIKKIEGIIREEMNSISGQEVEMTTLQDSGKWKQAGKWDDDVVDIWFKTQLKNGAELGMAFSHEEAFAELLGNHINSYKDLPRYVYQFQTKFRNELRAKSGIMRGREFYMKDMYSFNTSISEMNKFYKEASDAYERIFSRAGIGDFTFKTVADGSVFGDRSHEFQTVSEVGEDIIYIDEDKKLAINKEVYTDEKIKELDLDKGNLIEKKSIEVGNIFPIEDKVSKSMDFTFKNSEGKEELVIMGSYGIGLGRLMGAIVETLSDDKGIVWPKEVSPFDIHLVTLGTDNEEVVEFANHVYDAFKERGIEVLYDDRDARPGEKLADSDLIGISTRIVIGKKTIESGEVEVVDRKTGKVRYISESEIMSGEFLNIE